MKLRIIIGVAFAVCAAAVIGAVTFVNWGGQEQSSQDGIKVFENYSQIEDTLNDIEEEPIMHALGGVEEAVPNSDGGLQAEEGGAKHSDTYLQVEGIDEADIIKTDGKYVYYTSRLGYDVVIEKIEGETTKEAALITEEETGITADQMFLSDGKLIIIGSEETDSFREIATSVCFYDVSDPEKPEFIEKYSQSGGYVSSRINNGYLYLVTTDYLNTESDRIVPMAGTGNDYAKLEADHICCFPKPSQRAYVVAGAVALLDDGSMQSETKAVLGASEDIYCNDHALYVISTRFDEGDTRTQIMKADIADGTIDFAEEGSVRGQILNQFSMDEKDGYFRIATTAFIRDKDVNYLYVLDEKLNAAGKVRGFAAGEEIKAVRYLEDMAYVITYEQTDPLFVIDLTDPKNPEMLGSVEITGFSSLLVPAGEGRLIGIGSATSEEEFGEVEDGLKIALFDISDPKSPQVLDSRTYRDLSSEVQYDHKALIENPEEGWYAFGYYSWEEENGGILQFKAEGDKLVEIDDHASEKGIDRCVYAGDYLYGLPGDEDKLITWEITH